MFLRLELPFGHICLLSAVPFCLTVKNTSACGRVYKVENVLFRKQPEPENQFQGRASSETSNAINEMLILITNPHRFILGQFEVWTIKTTVHSLYSLHYCSKDLVSHYLQIQQLRRQQKVSWLTATGSPTFFPGASIFLCKHAPFTQLESLTKRCCFFFFCHKALTWICL